MKNNLHPRHELLLWEGLPGDAQQALRSITRAHWYQTGSTLFVAGQEPRGVLLLNAGKVKVLASSSKDNNVTLRIAGPGEVLGLSATIAGNHYEATAEAIGPAQADFAWA